MIFNEICNVVYNREIAKNIFEAKLSSKKISKSTKPGQFVNILPSIKFENVMRRPMSISHQDHNTISIIYKSIGEGTRIMKGWKEGEDVDIIGPLGNYWDVDCNKESILIGGGVGIAPILNLYNATKDHGKVSLFIGAREKDEHFLKHDESKKVYLSTDDGSYGIKGNLFEALQRVFSIEELQNKVLYVCGPPMMMEVLRKFSIDNDIKCYLALETIMACGIGICQGCTLETNNNIQNQEHSYRSKYELVCMDGPIYNAKEVKTCFL